MERYDIKESVSKSVTYGRFDTIFIFEPVLAAFRNKKRKSTEFTYNTRMLLR